MFVLPKRLQSGPTIGIALPHFERADTSLWMYPQLPAINDHSPVVSRLKQWSILTPSLSAA